MAAPAAIRIATPSSASPRRTFVRAISTRCCISECCSRRWRWIRRRDGRVPTGNPWRTGGRSVVLLPVRADFVPGAVCGRPRAGSLPCQEGEPEQDPDAAEDYEDDATHAHWNRRTSAGRPRAALRAATDVVATGSATAKMTPRLTHHMQEVKAA